MAMFGWDKYNNLESNYIEGKDFFINGQSFNLTLVRILPSPTRILDYAWTITLPDGTKINAKMAPDSISYPSTRLEQIKERLRSQNILNEQLAIEINNKIDEIYNEYNQY